MAFKVCLPQRLERSAKAAGLTVENTIDGRFVIRSFKDKSFVGKFNTESEAKEFVTSLLNGNAEELIGGPFPTRGQFTSSAPLLPQAQLTPLRRAVKSVQTAAAFLTPAKQMMLNISSLRGWDAFNIVYKPTQAALHAVDVARAYTKRAGLATKDAKGGRTIQQALHGLSRSGSRLSKDQQRLVTLLPEALTKQEIEMAGTVLPRAMSELEINLANSIAKVGQAEEIPFILRKIALVRGFIRNQQKVLDNYIPSVEQAIADGKLDPRLQDVINNLKVTAGNKIEDADEIIRALGMTDEERYVFDLLSVNMGNEAVDLNVVYRHATAPTLRKGFKNGRQQFIADRKVSPEAVLVAAEREKLLMETFKAVGMSEEQGRRVLFGQLPIFRRFTDAGLWSGKQWGRNVSTLEERRALDVLNGLEEGSDILSRRVLSGHINPRELDPVVSADRHVENLLRRKLLDPIMPDIADQVKEFSKNVDDRLGRFMMSYLNDVEGLPSGDFEWLNGAVRSVVRMTGVNLDERVGERWINTLVRLTSQATIPFRAGLVFRNATQSPFFTLPVIGRESYTHGLKVALGADSKGGFSRQALQEAVDRAVKAGAIDPNILPIHASTEVFNASIPKLSKANVLLNDMFDLGFTIYRTPDDLGRVIAFEGMRHRVLQRSGDFLQGKISLEDYFKQAKVLTFDEAIIANAEQMALRAKAGTGTIDELANFLGKELADKTHMLYGNANHPAGWGGIAGRLFGQFGTFPTQYLNYMLENVSKNVNSKDWYEFIALHSALNMGVIYAGAKLLDADLENWATFGSLTYTGGPYAEAAISLIQAYGGSDAERSLAMRNLKMMFPTFDSPQSVFVPGSYFIGDFVDAFQQDNLVKAIGELGGIRFLKPGESTWVENALGWVEEIR